MFRYVFLLFIFNILLIGNCLSQQVPTVKYYQRSVPIINWIDNDSYGQTSYQIDKSITLYPVPYNNSYIKAYYLYFV